MAETTPIQIQLTREQELQIAAATGLLIGTLAVEVEALAEGGGALAQIPEAVLDPQPEVLEERGTPEDDQDLSASPGTH